MTDHDLTMLARAAFAVCRKFNVGRPDPWNPNPVAMRSCKYLEYVMEKDFEIFRKEFERDQQIRKNMLFTSMMENMQPAKHPAYGAYSQPTNSSNGYFTGTMAERQAQAYWSQRSAYSPPFNAYDWVNPYS